MYENGTGIVAIGRVREEWDGKAHSDVWYYPDDAHEYRIRVRWLHNLSGNPIPIDELKKVLGYQPRWAVRRIRKRAAEVESLISEYQSTDKKSEETVFLEGEKRATKGTVRNPKLREAAKKKYGLKCYCCGFDYEAFYGSIGKGVAIVHHLELFPFLISESA
jgi:predicted HNH restriction endonuclease